MHGGFQPWQCPVFLGNIPPTRWLNPFYMAALLWVWLSHEPDRDAAYKIGNSVSDPWLKQDAGEQGILCNLHCTLLSHPLAAMCDSLASLASGLAALVAMI